MEIPFLELATDQADKLISDNIQKTLASRESLAKAIKEALIPAFGIRRGAAVIRRIDTDRINRIFGTYVILI